MKAIFLRGVAQPSLDRREMTTQFAQKSNNVIFEDYRGDGENSNKPTDLALSRGRSKLTVKGAKMLDQSNIRRLVKILTGLSTICFSLAITPASHASPASFTAYPGTLCHGDTVEDDKYVAHRGVAAVNLHKDRRDIGIQCPIPLPSGKTPPNIWVRYHLVEPGKIRCELQMRDNSGQILEGFNVRPKFTDTRVGGTTIPVKYLYPKKRDPYGFATLDCRLPYNAELRSISVHEQ